MANPVPVRCGVCGGEDLEDADDGFFYCRVCGSRADDIIDTGVADEDFIDKTCGLSQGGGALYLASHRRTNPGPSQSQLHFSQQLRPKPDPDLDPDADGLGPTQPTDFALDAHIKGLVFKDDDYFRLLRWRYVVGVQIMVQLQCEVLVNVFRVNPIVCGIAGSIWLRFVGSTRVFEEDWAYQAVLDSESQGEKKSTGSRRYEGEPRNIYNERMIFVWCKSLKRTIPLSTSLAVSYLACHIAREPILPTDILKWTSEGKLPYFAAFVEIEKSMEKLDKSIKYMEIPVQMPDFSVKNFMVSIAKPPRVLCPLSSSYMFRPSQAVPPQKLESMAASIAESLGLNLPPVNFYAIASRYLKQLSLPVGKIISYACRMYEWSMPPDLWLSASEFRLPTRVCVMSILIVTIRILYNINGLGKWEMTLSAPIGSSSMNDQAVSSDPTCEMDTKDDVEEGSASLDQHGDNGTSLFSIHKFESESAELLCNLEKKYDEANDDKYEFSKDLPTYLQYCKDVIFAGSCEDRAEEELIDHLWDFYVKNQENIRTPMNHEAGLNQKRSRDDDKLFYTPLNESKKHRDEETISPSTYNSKMASSECSPSAKTLRANQMSASSSQVEASNHKFKDVAITHMKIDMEDHRFCYIPPRVKIKVKGNDYLHYRRKKDDGSLNHVAHADYYILLRACAKAAQVDVRVMHAGVLSFERRLAWIEKRIDHCLQKICSNPRSKSHTDFSDESVHLENLNI